MCCCNRIGNGGGGGAPCYQCFQALGGETFTDNQGEDEKTQVGLPIVIPAGTLTPGMILVDVIEFDDIDGTPNNDTDGGLRCFLDSDLDNPIQTINVDFAFDIPARDTVHHKGTVGVFYGTTIKSVDNAALFGTVSGTSTAPFAMWSTPYTRAGFVTVSGSAFSSQVVIKDLDPTIDHILTWFIFDFNADTGIVVTPRAHHLTLSHGE